ncbi:hypothetical protein ATN84_10415 [Paramesorhizobium deserti]|uniref:Uncharacterized protein n=1 Tax=Paramesorhizobium deserti TaxID=1494590 RepID=A0A135HX10_9HYPH|nr:hypothetical protein ATN84_10415 [Paramesorhizobium deserti]
MRWGDRHEPTDVIIGPDPMIHSGTAMHRSAYQTMDVVSMVRNGYSGRSPRMTELRCFDPIAKVAITSMLVAAA